MSKKILIAVFCLLFSLPLFAQEIPVNIKSETLKFVEGTGIVIATGSVEVTFKDVIIYADRLRMDSETNVATAEGNVRIITKDYKATSDHLVYDADTELTAFSNFKTKLAPKRIRGHLYMTAEELTDLGDKMIGRGGTISTCDYSGKDQPHFYTKADRIEYYPEDKIVGYNVTLYVGQTPAFWLPVAFYDLSQKRKQNWVFGHNAVEGDYIKSTWIYPLGLLYLDSMQKKGFGYGTEVPYALLGLGAGTFFLYHLNEKDTGIEDWVTRIDHEKQINPFTTLKLNHAYTATYLIPAGRKDQTAFGLDLGYKDKARWNLRLNTYDDRIAQQQKYSFGFSQAYEKISTNYNFNYDFSKKDPKWIRASQRLQHRRPLWSDNVMLTTRVDYHNNVADAGDPGDERLEPQFEIHGKETNFTWAYRSNWYIDLDKSTYLGDENYQFMEKLPEIDIAPNPIDLQVFRLSPSFGYGYYREVKYVPALSGNRDFATTRLRSTLNANKSIPLALGTVAVLGAGIDQYLYGPGDELFAYRESLSLRTGWGTLFRNTVNYKKGLTEGNSPFLFDKLGTRYHNATETMSFYYKNNFNWTTSTGYNWQTEKWFDVMTNMRVSPRERISWKVRTGWSIENRQYKDMVNSLGLSPYDFLGMEFSTVSDLNNGDLKSGSILYDVYFLKGQPNQMRVKLSQVYEPATEQFKLRDIMLVKDLHCWEIKYTYSDYRKEFSLTMTLKAIPDEPIGVSTGRGFYFEGFEKQMKELKPEKAIKRY